MLNRGPFDGRTDGLYCRELVCLDVERKIDLLRLSRDTNAREISVVSMELVQTENERERERSTESISKFF